jgi:hypothetical protein
MRKVLSLEKILVNAPVNGPVVSLEASSDSPIQTRISAPRKLPLK